MTPHILGWLAFAVDIVALSLLARPSWRARWWGMAGMAVVNALFLAQGACLENLSLAAVSGVSFVLQCRVLWRWKNDG